MHESQQHTVSIGGVQCICTVTHEPDPNAIAQIRSIMVEGLVQALLKEKAAVSN